MRRSAASSWLGAKGVGMGGVVEVGRGREEGRMVEMGRDEKRTKARDQSQISHRDEDECEANLEATAKYLEADDESWLGSRSSVVDSKADKKHFEAGDYSNPEDEGEEEGLVVQKGFRFRGSGGNISIPSMHTVVMRDVVPKQKSIPELNAAVDAMMEDMVGMMRSKSNRSRGAGS